jgi:hypothetical protein
MTLGTHLRSAVAALLMAAAPGLAQVACTSPNVLCTGDPCVIGAVEVGDPCNLDFGARTVVVAGTILLPTNGTLSLTAGAIEVAGGVRNRPDARNVGGAGPHVTLTATGDVDVSGSIRLNGRVLHSLGAPVPGAFEVDAGGALTLGGSVRTTTVPTVIDLAAGGDVEFGGRAAVAAGEATAAISAGGRVALGGTLKGFARITVDAGTDVGLTKTIRFSDRLTVDAGGVVTVDTAIRIPKANVTLGGAGGIDLLRRMDLLAVFVPGGSAELTSTAGPVTIGAPLNAQNVTITAAGNVAVNAPVSVSPPTDPAGAIHVTSLTGGIAVDGTVTALSGDGTRPGDGAGGEVHLSAATAVVVHEDIRANSFPGNAGAPGGAILLEAPSVQVGPDVMMTVDGDVPGPDFPGRPPASIRFHATAGALQLDGTFRARGGPSVIEGAASANLTASGRFEALPSGCIGLSAGGVLDVGGASFDTPPVASCP